MISETKSFRFSSNGEYYTLKLLEDSSLEDLENFENNFKEEAGTSPKHLIVNCSELEILSNKWIRSLLEAQITLRTAGFKTIFIQLSSKFKHALKLQGLDISFQSAPTLREALPLLGLSSKKRLDAEFINPFLDATLHVLKVQGGVDAVAGKYFLKKDEDLLFGDVSGIIGIVSEAFNGTVIISFPEQTFLNVMSGMLGEPMDVLTKDLIDGAGEITNMIFGQAKVTLNEKGYGIKMALPSVVSGKDHSLSAITKGTVLIIPFKSSGGDFFVEICLSA